MFLVTAVTELFGKKKGPPDQIVFEKGAYVGTYCGVLMNDLLLWGCDKGMLKLTEKSNLLFLFHF